MSWFKKLSKSVSDKLIQELIQQCEILGGERTLLMGSFYRNNQLVELLNHSFDYDSATSDDVNDFFYARQIQALFSKRQGVLTEDEMRLNTEVNFVGTEAQCLLANARFRHQVAPTGAVESILFRSRLNISDILGDVPMLEDLNCKFGPGSTSITKTEHSNIRYKLSCPLVCNHNLLPHVGDFLAEFPLLCDVNDINVESNDDSYNVNVDAVPDVMMMVAKSWKSLRVIMKGSPLAGLGQSGIGLYIKERLLFKRKINLWDQTRNQRLAFESSLSGRDATIDLSNASDTVCYGLVLDQIPLPWFNVLDAFRSTMVTYKRPNEEEAHTFELEKFSSMGNGYTFELESLIFYSLTYSVCEHLRLPVNNISVFGDDIICPVEAVPLLKEVFDYCGLSINLDKSYWSGNFRESCGADFLHGIDIRPFYLRKSINVEVLFLMHNFFIRNCEPALAMICKRYIPNHLRIYGPDGYGDGHLLGDWTPRTNRELKRNGFCGGFFDTFVHLGASFEYELPGDYIYPAYSVYVRSGASDESDPNSLRGTSGYKKISIYTLSTSIFIQYPGPLDSDLNLHVQHGYRHLRTINCTRYTKTT